MNWLFIIEYGSGGLDLWAMQLEAELQPILNENYFSISSSSNSFKVTLPSFEIDISMK